MLDQTETAMGARSIKALGYQPLARPSGIAGTATGHSDLCWLQIFTLITTNLVGVATSSGF